MMLEFHILRSARDRHQFDGALFTTSGRVIFADFAAARRFAAALNAVSPGRNARAGDVNAMGLIDEVLHALLLEYRENHAPKLWQDALMALRTQYGERLDSTLERFAREFPPTAVYQNKIKLKDYLAVPANKEVLIEEMLLLWLENNNPAFNPYKDLFEDEVVATGSAYRSVISSLESWLETQPGFAAAGGMSLWKALRTPALLHPDSLEAQLRALMARFGGVFQRRGMAGRFATLELKLRGGLDLFAEEARFFVAQNARVFGGAGGFEAEAQIRQVSRQMLEEEPEAFTLDQNWMPRVVLMAKNAFVWLDQLSKRYGQQIRTLDQIPDNELETLARWGITGLWLIGLWERSSASKEIKHRMGNPDAVASAYSLWDYSIAHALGGDAALENLKTRAWRFGIRMASDMVPNHTGIDSRWMAEHPDWFLQRGESPYPSYTYHSQNLSTDNRMQVFLEDHYYDKSDAAVTFKHIDNRTGQTRIIYHGNDGTSLPWNDTAQLDYMNPAAREAVIQTIFRVARQFPIIRFDAAMTLAKRHIKRLWFPEPGSGEGIASRNEYGMTREEFDRIMPNEFWREVVDRAAFEVPDTLLLAEAFWMMEGYFVRTLGMHRVYNSAFMVMLRDERNAEYKDVIKNTLEFEPEILKRYVNFLSNPDEKTAVEQFGKTDKYFGIMTLCATLPGLPMLGHGQVEGFTEKYGMEYQRAYYDEIPDGGFMAHHETQIFPLLKKRYLFAEVQQFALYDVNHEHVFAFSNRAGSERALIFYNNSVHHANVSINGCLYAERRSGIGEALQLSSNQQHYLIYRDNVSGLEYIRNSAKVVNSSFQIELGAYGRAVLLDWHEVIDTDGRYARLEQMLGGRGVEHVETTVQELYLEKILTPWNDLVNASHARALLEPTPKFLGELEARAKALADGVETHTKRNLESVEFAKNVRAELQNIKVKTTESALEQLALSAIKHLEILTNATATSISSEWLLSRQLERAFRDNGSHHAHRDAARVLMLACHRSEFKKSASVNALIELMGLATHAQAAIGLNTYQGKRYVHAEAFTTFISTAKTISSKTKVFTDTEKVVQDNGYSLDFEAKKSKTASKAKVPTPKAKKISASEPKVAKAEPKTSSAKTAKSTTVKPKKATKPVETKTAKAFKSEGAKPATTTKAPAKPEKAVKPIAAKPKTVTKPITTSKTKKSAVTLEPTESKPKTVAARHTSPATAKTTKAPAKATTTKAVAKPAVIKPKKIAAKPEKTSSLPDDLTRVEGIGPKIATALNAAGITTFASLASSTPETLKSAIEAASIRLAPSLESWATQASLLAQGDEVGFKALTNTLVAGKKPAQKVVAKKAVTAKPKSKK